MNKNRLFLLTLILLLGILLTACSGSAAASSWPGLSADQNTAYLAFNQEVYAVNVADGSITEKWRFPNPVNNKISFYSPPAMAANKQLLAGGFDHILYSINSDNGSQVWTFTQAKDRYIGAPLVTDKAIFAPNADGNLYALDLNGKLLWTFKTEDAQWAAPALGSNCNCIYVPSMDHFLYAVDMQSGKQIWKTEDLGGSLVGTPAVSPDGVLYVGTFNSEMRAIDAKTGKTIWKVPTAGWVWGGPVLKDQTLYFGDLSGTFYSMDRSNGKINWNPKLDGTITESPLLTKDAIYISTETGGLYALDFNGKTVWSKTIGTNGAGKLHTSPALANNLILVAPVGTSELLFAFDSAGNQKSTYTPAKK